MDNMTAGLSISHVDKQLGPIVRDAEGCLAPIWCYSDDTIDCLVRAEDHFRQQSADEVERVVIELKRRANLQRIAGRNVLARIAGVER